MEEGKSSYRNQAMQACDTTEGSIRRTLRGRLKSEIESNNQMIAFSEQKIEEAENILKVLDKNKDLETLVNLIERR